jgi:hypothetical protein
MECDEVAAKKLELGQSDPSKTFLPPSSAMSSIFELILTASLTANALAVPVLVYLASVNKELRENIGVIAAALQGSAPGARPAPNSDRIRRLQAEVMNDLAEAEARGDRNAGYAAERARARSRSPTPATPGRPQRPGVRLSRSIARRASTVDMSSCRIVLGGRHATLAAM